MSIQLTLKLSYEDAETLVMKSYTYVRKHIDAQILENITAGSDLTFNLKLEHDIIISLLEQFSSNKNIVKAICANKSIYEDQNFGELVKNEFWKCFNVDDSQKVNYEHVKMFYDIGTKTKSKIDLNEKSRRIGTSGEAFSYFCATGKLDKAKCLYKLGVEYGKEIDIHMFTDGPFTFACQGGHIEVAQWLYQIGIETGDPINVNEPEFMSEEMKYGEGRAFARSRKNGNPEMTNWLITVGAK